MDHASPLLFLHTGRWEGREQGKGVYTKGGADPKAQCTCSQWFTYTIKRGCYLGHLFTHAVVQVCVQDMFNCQQAHASFGHLATKPAPFAELEVNCSESFSFSCVLGGGKGLTQEV